MLTSTMYRHLITAAVVAYDTATEHGRPSPAYLSTVVECTVKLAAGGRFHPEAFDAALVDAVEIGAIVDTGDGYTPNRVAAPAPASDLVADLAAVAGILAA